METLYKLFYIDQSKFKEEYNKRFNSHDSIHLGINIGNYEAFYNNNSEIYKLLLDINKKNAELISIQNMLPKEAFNNYITKSLIDEIRMSNEIESVFSTRKEISSILIDLEKKNKKNRFYGLVNKYSFLRNYNSNDFLFKDSLDIRKLYDDVFLDEIFKQDKELIPDGKIFRKDSVSVVSSTQKIHDGIMPEEKIIEYMNKSLDYLNNNDSDILVKLSVFHYLFGYIHPFYDGNGRLNRLISSFYLKSLNQIIPFRLSYTIKENVKGYYEAFKIVNHPNNRGDITPFIIMFLNMINLSIDNVIESLKNKLVKYEFYSKILNKTKYSNNKKLMNLLNTLLTASLFTNLGIYKKDLVCTLEISLNSLTNYLSELDKNIVISNCDGNKTYYLLNLDYLDSLV